MIPRGRVSVSNSTRRPSRRTASTRERSRLAPPERRVGPGIEYTGRRRLRITNRRPVSTVQYRIYYEICFHYYHLNYLYRVPGFVAAQGRSAVECALGMVSVVDRKRETRTPHRVSQNPRRDSSVRRVVRAEVADRDESSSSVIDRGERPAMSLSTRIAGTSTASWCGLAPLSGRRSARCSRP